MKTVDTDKVIYSRGVAEVVYPKDIPLYLYHATATKNLENILNKGFELGKEETRSLEMEWEEVRPVEDKIFFTESPDTAGYFGMQAIESMYKRAKKKLRREDIDYVILKISTAEFERSNFYAYRGAELFGTGQREYFVKYKVPRFWIEGGIRVYWDEKKNTIVRDGFRVKWHGPNYTIIPIKEEWV